MIMALEHAERVSELVVIDIAPQIYHAPPEEDRPTIVALRAMIKTDLNQLRTREYVCLHVCLCHRQVGFCRHNVF